MRNPKFKIGDPVNVLAKVLVFTEVEFDKSVKREYNRVKVENVSGLIVGAVYRFAGKLVIPPYPDEEQSYLRVSGSVLLWQVRTGYLNKPIEVLEEDIELRSEPLNIPWKYAKQPLWSEKDREVLRRDVASAPRDSKGMWVKIKGTNK